MRIVCRVRFSFPSLLSPSPVSPSPTERFPFLHFSSPDLSQLAREVLDIAAAALRPGVTTLEIDAIVHEECVKRNSYPSPLGYYKFPRSVCTSVNEVICHGSPSLPYSGPQVVSDSPSNAGIPDARPLVEGDIINLDVTLYHEYNGQGYHGDLNATCSSLYFLPQLSYSPALCPSCTDPIGKVSQQNLDLIATARECLDESIRLCAPKFQYQDFGSTIEAIASKKGFSTNRKYCGHGINQCVPPSSSRFGPDADQE